METLTLVPSGVRAWPIGRAAAWQSRRACARASVVACYSKEAGGEEVGKRLDAEAQLLGLPAWATPRCRGGTGRAKLSWWASLVTWSGGVHLMGDWCEVERRDLSKVA